jgi:hypothetical protein
VTVEAQPAGSGGDLAWAPVSTTALSATKGPGGITLWTAAITLPDAHGSRPFRLRIEEFEIYQTGTPGQSQNRLVYADVLPLPTVAKAGVTMTLDALPNPASFGQRVNFSVSVSALSGGGIPTGTVRFSENGLSLGSPVPLANGKASLSTTSLRRGSPRITAAYSGDAIFQPSSVSKFVFVN